MGSEAGGGQGGVGVGERGTHRQDERWHNSQATRYSGGFPSIVRSSTSLDDLV